ncbi:MAG: hypothetical protein QFB87_00945 [Patescibacteria group bacterium]|nr:hypothetical protein [Patescibacteria group bacterium]
MSIKVYYAVSESIPETENQQKLLEHLAGFPVELVATDAATDDVEAVDGVIADITKTSEEQVDRLQQLGGELGIKTLLLMDRSQAGALDERLQGLSKINAEGVRYSSLAIAEVAVTVFLRAHFGIAKTSEADDRLAHPVSQDMAAKGLGAAAIAEIEQQELQDQTEQLNLFEGQ